MKDTRRSMKTHWDKMSSDNQEQIRELKVMNKSVEKELKNKITEMLAKLQASSDSAEKAVVIRDKKKSKYNTNMKISKIQSGKNQYRFFCPFNMKERCHICNSSQWEKEDQSDYDRMAENCPENCCHFSCALNFEPGKGLGTLQQKPFWFVEDPNYSCQAGMLKECWKNNKNRRTAMRDHLVVYHGMSKSAINKQFPALFANTAEGGKVEVDDEENE